MAQLMPVYDRIKGPSGWQKVEPRSRNHGESFPARALFAGNVKDTTLSIEDIKKLVIKLGQVLTEVQRTGGDPMHEPEVVMALPFTALYAVKDILSRPAYGSILLGAQDVHWTEVAHSYTGDIPAAVLKGLDVKYCIVGHSERRRGHSETNEDVHRKATALLEAGISPIVCVGEGEDFAPHDPRRVTDAELSRAWQFISGQLAQSFLAKRPAQEVEKGVVAYEPCWAIGTGTSAQPDYSDKICGLIRDLIANKYGPEVAARFRIQYGGSVKPENIVSFMEFPNIDGALVGGASRDAVSMGNIVRLGIGFFIYNSQH